MNKPKICLSMIVKNEAHVIERCLDSVVGIIDYWVISDTGSTDGTQDIIRKYFAKRGIAGALVEHEWVNFGHNRTEAIRAAEERRWNEPMEGPGYTTNFEYLLFIDADEVLHVPEDLQWSEPMGLCYQFDVKINDTLEFKRNALVKARAGFRWEGVLHEYLTRDEPHFWQTLPLLITSSHDGARSKDPETYLKDIAVLEAAVEADPTNTRNVFYLAQSCRDALRDARAVRWYKRRVDMGGWAEEVWYSKFQLGRLYERIYERDAGHAQQAYLDAFAYRPTRAEPLVELARFLRERKEYVLAAIYAHAATLIPHPKDVLFIDAPSYRWRALDELAVSGYYAGDTYRELGAQAAKRLIEENQYPTGQRQRIFANHAFYWKDEDAQ